MDMMVELVARTIGLEVASVLAVFAVVSMICQTIGKAIPDSTTGVLGIVRKVCKVVGLYVGNRVTPGMNANDAARVVAERGVR